MGSSWTGNDEIAPIEKLPPQHASSLAHHPVFALFSTHFPLFWEVTSFPNLDLLLK